MNFKAWIESVSLKGGGIDTPTDDYGADDGDFDDWQFLATLEPIIRDWIVRAPDVKAIFTTIADAFLSESLQTVYPDIQIPSGYAYGQPCLTGL